MAANRITMTQQWIWQAADWPRFRYDLASLAPLLGNARQAQGHLLGKAESVGAAGLSSALQNIWTGDALATSAIEGEKLDVDAVRSSVARRLGIESSFMAAVPPNIEGLIDVMEDAASRWNSDVNEERLCGWQAALFPSGYSGIRKIQVGQYRSHAAPMQIVSGPLGHEKMHYEAPPSAAVRAEMRLLLDWFNRTRDDSSIEKLLRAAIAHLWFETIHPFEDGNGRVGRALADMALAQDVKLGYRLHGLSVELLRLKRQYYEALNDAQRGDGEITLWLGWFLQTFCTACTSTSRLIDDALARARFWSEHNTKEVNERQRKVLNKMLDAGPGSFEGGMTNRKYVSMTQSASATATRELTDLTAKGLLVQKGAGRSVRYDIAIPGWEWQPNRPPSADQA